MARASEGMDAQRAEGVACRIARRMVRPGMFGFLVKKAFFDMWDNMFRIIIMNLGYILILRSSSSCPVLAVAPLLQHATVVFGVAFFALYTGVVSRMCAEIADYKQPGFPDFSRFLKESYGSSLLLARRPCRSTPSSSPWPSSSTGA